MRARAGVYGGAAYAVAIMMGYKPSGGSGGGGGGGYTPDPPPIPFVPSGLTPVAAQCTKSTNWNSGNADDRYMNMLAPKMSTAKFNSYLSVIKSRGCNTCHLYVCNNNDTGANCREAKEYSIYGSNFDWSIDQSYCNTMLSRIDTIRSQGLHTVLWLAADDDGGWNSRIASNPTKYAKDLSDLGFFSRADTVCVGLETDEYWNLNQVTSVSNAVRQYYDGTIAVHQSTNRYNFHSAADVIFVQLAPGSSKSKIQSFVQEVITNTGKAVNMFELERIPDRQRSQWALDAGAYAIGNW